MSAPMLSIAALSVRFGGLVAVDDVTFDVAAGSTHGLIGPNGAGKTTMFNLISGLTPPTSGAIRLADREINNLPSWKRAALGLSRTFQNIRVFPEMTLAENVATGLHPSLVQGFPAILTRLGGFAASERRARDIAMEQLEFVGLAAKARQRAGDLPYGDQRRLEIARALANQPRLLMLDEPAAGMNPSEKLELLGLLERLKGRGLTMLVVEHDMKFVMRLCDRISVINFGRKIAEGAPAEVRANADVIEAYLGAKVARGLEKGA